MPRVGEKPSLAAVEASVTAHKSPLVDERLRVHVKEQNRVSCEFGSIPKHAVTGKKRMKW
jgi:hypothetical protein